MSLVKHKFRLADGTQKESTDWYFRFTYKGKPYFGSTNTANKTLAKKVEEKKRQSLIERLDLGKPESISVKDALSEYLDANVDSSQIKNLETRVNKLLGTKYDSTYGGIKHKPMKVFGFDGNRAFDSLVIADAQQLVLARRKEGCSNGTILVELSAWSQAIKLNKKLGRPVPDIDFAELKKDNNIKPAKGRLRYLSKEEEEALLSQLHPDNFIPGTNRGWQDDEDIRAMRQDVYDIAVVLLGTGARYSEIAKLTWKSVDLKNRAISLYRNKVKNESILAMTKRAYEVLTRRHETKTTEYVFNDKAGVGPRKYSPRAFKSACKRAGIVGVTFRTTRKTTASRLVQKGVPIYDVSKLLGHSNVTTTVNHYGFLVPNQSSARAAEVLNEIDET